MKNFKEFNRAKIICLEIVEKEKRNLKGFNFILNFVTLIKVAPVKNSNR